jgi:hypothetical protein
MFSGPSIPPPPPAPEIPPPPPDPAAAGKLKPISGKSAMGKGRGKGSLVIPRSAVPTPASGSKAAGINIATPGTAKSGGSSYGVRM